MARGYKYFEAIEKNAALLGILIVVLVSFGGLAEIMPLFIEAHAVAPATGVEAVRPAAPRRQGRLRARGLLPVPLADDPRAPRRNAALRSVLGRLRIRVRPAVPVGLQAHRARSRAHRRQILRRVAAPASASLRARSSPSRTCRPTRGSSERKLDGADIAARMRALRTLGDPYTDATSPAAPKAVARQDRARRAGRLSARTRRCQRVAGASK